MYSAVCVYAPAVTMEDTSDLLGEEVNDKCLHKYAVSRGYVCTPRAGDLSKSM